MLLSTQASDERMQTFWSPRKARGYKSAHGPQSSGALCYELASQLPCSVLSHIIAFSGMDSPPCQAWLEAFKSMLAHPEELATYLTARHGTKEEALVQVASWGQLDGIIVMLDHGADINHRQGRALSEAASWGEYEAVELLLDRGADVHAGNDMALYLAAIEGDVEVMRLLLDRGADVHAGATTTYDWNPLERDRALSAAAGSGCLEAVRLLLDRGADMNASTAYGGSRPLGLAAESGHLQVVLELLSRSSDLEADVNKALGKAATGGHTQLVEFLLSFGADPRANAGKPLDLAAVGGCLKTMKLLIRHAEQLVLYHWPDWEQLRVMYDWALVEAARQGQTKMARLLIKEGADVRFDDDKALHVAVIGGHEETVRMLLRHDACPRPGGECVGTLCEAVMLCEAAHGDLGMVRALLENTRHVVQHQDVEHAMSLVVRASADDPGCDYGPLIELLVQHGAPAHDW